jgi:hypothetical protein
MNKKNIAYLLLAAAAFVLLTRRQSAAPAQPSPTLPPVPPRPATTGQALTNWVITVMRLFGTAKELWEPGGPFYGRDRNKDLQMLPNNLPPNTNNTGYV